MDQRDATAVQESQRVEGSASESDCEVGDELVEKEACPDARLHSYQSQQIFHKHVAPQQVPLRQAGSTASNNAHP